jgi:hypothetical protein
MKKSVTFLFAAIVFWVPVTFGLGVMADAVGLPDTEIWTWILRAFAVLTVACIGWVIIGAARAREISLAIMGMISIISNFLLLACFILGAVAVVMIFVRDSKWLYEHLYHPFLSGAVTVALVSLLPLALNWLRVLATAELPHVDQGVRHQFHAKMTLLNVFKTQEESLEFIFPGECSIHPSP